MRFGGVVVNNGFGAVRMGPAVSTLFMLNALSAMTPPRHITQAASARTHAFGPSRAQSMNLTHQVGEDSGQAQPAADASSWYDDSAPGEGGTSAPAAAVAPVPPEDGGVDMSRFGSNPDILDVLGADGGATPVPRDVQEAAARRQQVFRSGVVGDQPERPARQQRQEEPESPQNQQMQMLGRLFMFDMLFGTNTFMMALVAPALLGGGGPLGWKPDQHHQAGRPDIQGYTMPDRWRDMDFRAESGPIRGNEAVIARQQRFVKDAPEAPGEDAFFHPDAVVAEQAPAAPAGGATAFGKFYKPEAVDTIKTPDRIEFREDGAPTGRSAFFDPDKIPKKSLAVDGEHRDSTIAGSPRIVTMPQDMAIGNAAMAPLVAPVETKVVTVSGPAKFKM